MSTFIKNNTLLLSSESEDYTYDPDKLVLVYDTNLESSTTISLPLLAGPVNVTVDWGDGTSNSYTTTGLKTHTYSSQGEYIVQVAGFLQRFRHQVTGSTSDNKPKLKRCLSFGGSKYSSAAASARAALVAYGWTIADGGPV